MADLADGESVEMKGSVASPYVIKNMGGVYSCSCPAWRNQSTPIEQRTCKHIRKQRGDEAENERIGGALPQKPVRAAKSSGDEDAGSAEPPILLAEAWDNSQDLAGWWMSEKLDGVRAYWDGKQFLSRQGNLYHAPDWFLEGLPSVPLDGELWIDRKAFQQTVSIVRRQDKNDQWRSVRYLVFDAPAMTTPFEERIAFLSDSVNDWRNEFVTVHPQELCRDVAHLRAELARIESLGGEGLMLRQPGSKYFAGRSSTLLKVKTFFDAEAVVLRHEPGKGRHAGRLGALAVKLPDGTEFSVGTGFSDRERESPPPIGSLIQFRYQELSDAGVPRFPSYIGLRTDVEAVATVAHVARVSAPPSPKPASRISVTNQPTAREPRAPQTAATAAATSPRYFEFIEGSSSKFWEITLSGSDVTTRWGRIGTDGQSKTKPFGTEDKATAEYDKLIKEKTDKGYVEIGGATGDDGDTETNSEDEQLNTVGLMARLFSEMSDGPRKARLQQQFDELAELFSLDKPEPPPIVSGIPPTIHLQATDGMQFDNSDGAAKLTKSILKAGFSLIGDFALAELPVKLRAFLRGTDTFAVINELGPHFWVELNVRNADDSSESWSNVPTHDGLRSPWTMAVREPQADFNRLHAMLLEGRSDKEPANLSASDFVSTYERAYARDQQWRETLKHEAARMDTSRKQEPVTTTELAKTITPISKEIEQLVLKFADEMKATYGNRFDPPDKVPSGKTILGLKPPQQVEVVRACLLLRAQIERSCRVNMVEGLRDRFLRRNLPYTDDDIRLLASEVNTLSMEGGLDIHLIGAIEAWARLNRLPLGGAQSLRQARDNAHRDWYQNKIDSAKSRIDAIVGDDATRIPIEPSEDWAVAAIKDIDEMPALKRSLWVQLLQCCVSATASKPTDKWLKSATPLIEAITREEFLKYANRWLPLVEKSTAEDRQEFLAFNPLRIHEGNQIILRGLVWFCSLAEDRDTTRTLGNLARTCFRTVPNFGPRSAKVGNTVVFTLGAMTIPDAVTQLAILKVKVKNGHAQKIIEGELNKAAERLGIGREELEEMSVPAYGLDEVGIRTDELGDFTAKLTVDSSGATELKWFKAGGGEQKSVPAKVPQEFADDLKELKAAAKDIQKMVGVQRERIDSLFLQQREWPFVAWADRYLNHPLVGILARRLLWVFRNGKASVGGTFLDGKLVGLNDEPLTGLGEGTVVSMWHPIGYSIDEIIAWREWLERHTITQPFKQAHREVYLLTDAERHTNVYSNRFAAHVLRQSQLRTLAQGRGWHAKLLGGWDGGGDAQLWRYLPRWNITAQFWVNAIYDDIDAAADMPETAGVPFVSTDQVRFYSGEHKEYAVEDDLMPLANVPELVLSEVMRDVDLFVGVASIGNDPNWQDGGETRFADYWTGYSFGNLSESAKTRREVLERLIPRLKIAPRCSFEDRFLVVRGDLRTYRIHFGSGNIQMEPNIQYLCIVPKPGSSGDMFLPFEGDRTLSIILSKALLLAEDKKIKDPTIVSQIKR